MKRAVMTLMGIFMLGITFSFAHAIWIETPQQGQKGTSHQIKVFFGEFGTEDISKTSDWLSDLDQFELQLNHPDGRQTQIAYKANGDHFIANFTPQMDGVYTITLHKIASEIYYGYKLDYMATAFVQVGNTGTFNGQQLPIGLRFDKTDARVGEPVDLSILFNQDLTGEKEITVISPNTWTKKMYTDDQSKTSFTPLWSGKYLVETSVTDKSKGVHNGREYTVDYHCHTYVIDVK